MKTKKTQTAEAYLKTCSDEEQDVVYEHYLQGWTTPDLVDELFHFMPSKPVKGLVEEYRRDNK
jgi:hypothetical protein